MKADNREAIKGKIKELKELWQEIYDYDYDESALWYISRAVESLTRAADD